MLPTSEVGSSRPLGEKSFGELLIKGPNIMKRYKNDDEVNRQVFVDKVWVRTGDLGRIEEWGTVTISDRLKKLKVNAYQVAPAELENIIKEHTAVLDAAVIGIPDDKTGELPKAFIILKKGSIITENEIMDYVAITNNTI